MVIPFSSKETDLSIIYRLHSKLMTRPVSLEGRWCVKEVS